MKKIFARFASRCAETGNPIKKGEQMYYDYATKKCYCMASNEAQYLDNKLDEKYKPIQSNNDFIQDPGEIYFDNFCQENNI